MCLFGVFFYSIDWIQVTFACLCWLSYLSTVPPLAHYYWDTLLPFVFVIFSSQVCLDEWKHFLSLCSSFDAPAGCIRPAALPAVFSCGGLIDVLLSLFSFSLAALSFSSQWIQSLFLSCVYSKKKIRQKWKEMNSTFTSHEFGWIALMCLCLVFIQSLLLFKQVIIKTLSVISGNMLHSYTTQLFGCCLRLNSLSSTFWWRAVGKTNLS